MNRYLLVILVLVWIPEGTCQLSCEEELRLNHIQVIGTHNSYHLRPEEALFRQVKLVYPDAKDWDYSHLPLDEQLDHGVRSFELDLYHTPEGFRVFHVPQYDKESTCPLFLDCLESVRLWSEKNPTHVPISFLLEIKEEEAQYSKTPILDIDRAAFDKLDSDIESVFGLQELLTPDDVRGSYGTLEEAILDEGWPLLKDIRGQVFFILHEADKNREMYLDQHDSLKGRAMFIRSEPGRPEAAVLIMDDPENPEIPERVREGYLVRTRADTRPEQASKGETARRDQALQSGAHIISTDFPPGEPHPESNYVVRFPGGATIRVSPVHSNIDCSIHENATKEEAEE